MSLAVSSKSIYICCPVGKGFKSIAIYSNKFVAIATVPEFLF
jgi:hypothetical protein